MLTCVDQLCKFSLVSKTLQAHTQTHTCTLLLNRFLSSKALPSSEDSDKKSGYAGRKDKKRDEEKGLLWYYVDPAVLVKDLLSDVFNCYSYAFT